MFIYEVLKVFDWIKWWKTWVQVSVTMMFSDLLINSKKKMTTRRCQIDHRWWEYVVRRDLSKIICWLGKSLAFIFLKPVLDSSIWKVRLARRNQLNGPRHQPAPVRRYDWKHDLQSWNLLRKASKEIARNQEVQSSGSGCWIDLLASGTLGLSLANGKARKKSDLCLTALSLPPLLCALAEPAFPTSTLVTSWDPTFQRMMR